MSVCDVSVYNRYFILIPQNKDKTYYEGYVMIQDKEFRIKFYLQSRESLANAKLECDWQLKNLIRAQEKYIEQKLHSSPSLQHFLDEFKMIIENSLRVKKAINLFSIQESTVISCILKEVEEIGWDKLLEADKLFNFITLKADDIKNRQHHLTILLDDQYPASIPKTVTDLPKPFNLRWHQHNGSLNFIYQQFILALEQYQKFWDVMDEIDDQCLVLEPETKSFSCCMRRIAIQKNCSIHLTINPQQPSVLPECRLLGADHAILPLRKKLNASLSLWDENQTVLANLRMILDVEFPCPTTESSDNMNTECGICYAFRLEDELPEKTCDDIRCSQSFHTSCLIEWLRGLPSSRQSFNVIFGECPYCSKPLTVKSGKVGLL